MTLRRVFTYGIVLAATLLACGREVTGPAGRAIRSAAIAWSPLFPAAYLESQLAAQQAVPFERVRITLLREDGTVAIDTVVLFPAGVDSIAVAISVPLPEGTPASGLPLKLSLGYLNAAGETVFRGGPVDVVALPAGAGSTTPPPVVIPVTYSGPGAGATAVRISPKTTNGTIGDVVSFSAQALNSAGTVIPNTPVIFASLDPTRATIANANVGTVVLASGRGPVRIVAKLLTGLADTAVINVTARPARLDLTGGSGQSALVGQTLPTAIGARVIGSDAQPLGGVAVTFTVVSGGGKVSVANATSNAAGDVSSAWTLGSLVGAQALDVASAGLTTIHVTAIAQALSARQLAVEKQPAAKAPIGKPLAPITFSAKDSTGATVTSFSSPVTVVLASSPAGAKLTGTTTVSAVAGIATFSNLNVDVIGTGYSFTATASGLTPVTTAKFELEPGAASKIKVDVQPTRVVAGASIVPAPAVVAKDSLNNILPTFTDTVGVSLIGGADGAKLAGNKVVTAVAGRAAFPGLSVDKLGDAYRLVFSSPRVAPDTSVEFRVTAGKATKLVPVSGNGQRRPASTTIDTIVVRVVDAADNGVDSVSVTFAVATGGGSVTPLTALTDKAGHARAVWTLGAPSGTQTLEVRAVGPDEGTITPSPLIIAATATRPPVRMLITRQPPASVVAGTALTPSILAEARDSLDAIVPEFVSPVSLRIAVNPSADTGVAGTSIVNAVDGIATFANASIRTAGVGYRLVVSGGGTLKTDTTTAFNVVAAAPRVLAIVSGDGQGGPAGSVLALPLVVRVTDEFGNAVSGATINWASIAGGAVVSPASSTTDSLGRASASASLGATPGTAAVSATAPAVGSSVTFTMTASAGPARVLALTSQPNATQVAGRAITPAVKVAARDSLGNLVASFTGTVTMAIGTNPAGAVLGGTVAVSAVNGVATFSALSVNKRGTGYTLSASASGLTGATTTGFAVIADTAVAMVKAVTDSVTVPVASAIPIRVRLTDANNNTVPNRAVSFSVSGGGGSIAPTSALSDTAGLASTIWTLGPNAATNTLTVNGGSLGTRTFTAFTVAGAARKLRITQNPGASNVAGTSLSPAIIVEARDSLNNLVTGFTGTVSLRIAQNPGADTAVAGTRSVAALGGVATFGAASLRKAGVNYRLEASASGLLPDTTAAFTVTAAAAASIAVVSGSGQSGTVAQALPTPLVAQVSDAFGNAVQGTSVTWVPSAGSVTPTSGTTSSSGQVSTTLTLPLVPGAVSVTATASGIGTPATFSATAQVGPASQLAWTQQPPASVTAGQALSPALAATVKDAQGNVATSFSGSVSVALGSNVGGAVLSGTTTVTAVAGVATFSTLSLDKVGAGYTLVASATGGISSATTSAFAVTPTAAASVAVDNGNAQTGVVGNALTTPLRVLVRDAFSNAISGTTVTWSTSNGSVTPASSVTDATGKATTSWTLGGAAGAQSAQASVAGVASPATFTATANPAAAASLLVTTQPAATQTAGVSGGNIVVQARDGSNNVATGFGQSVTVAIATGPSGATILGTPTVTASLGVATFTNIRFDKAGSYTLSFSSSGVPSVISTSFTVSAAAASQLVYTTPPSNATAGTVIAPPVVVQARDAFGNDASSFTGTVALSLSTNPTSATLSGTLSAAAAAGVATFSNLRIRTAGSGYVLTSASSGVTSAVSPAFNITAAPASVLVSIAGDAQTGSAGGALATALQVAVRDSAGNGVSGVTVNFATTSGGSLAPASASTNAQGLASSTWTLGNTPGAQTATASSTGLTGSPLTFNATAVIGAPALLAITTQPAGAVSSVLFTTQPVVEIRDAAGNRVTSATNAVTVAIASGTGGTLSGNTLTVNAVGGVATFAGLAITGSGAHTLTFTSGVLMTSVSVSVAAPPNVRLLVGAAPTASVTAGQQITLPLQLDMSGAAGRNVASITFDVTFDTARFTYVSTTAGSYGTATVGTTNAANGTVSISVFDAIGTTSSVTLRNIVLQAKAAATTVLSTVSAAVSVAADETAVNVTVTSRNNTVTISP